MKAIDISRYLIVSLYLFTTFYAVVYLAHDSVGLWRWQSSGYLESRLAENGDSTSVFRKAIPSDFVAAPIPVTGDTVLSIGGIRMFHDHHQRFVPSVRNDIEPFAPNEPLEITFVHAGDTLHSAIAMHPPSRRLTALQIFVDLLRHLIALSMLFVGGWGLLTRGNNVVVQVFALYCVSRAGEMLSAYFIPLAYGLLPHHLMWPFSVWFTALLTSGLVSFWLHLQFVFPKPLEWVKRHPILAFSICYLPTLIALLFFFRRWIPGFPDFIPAFLDSSEQSYFVDWSYLAAGVAILLFRYHTSSDSIERRQLRLFIGGSAIGLIADAILEILYAFWFEWYDSTPYIDLIGTAIVYSATLLGPLSFVYAFRRYRLMDIEAKLRRGTRYALVTGTFLAIAIGLVFIISRIVLDYTGVDSLTVTLALGFALSLGVVPAQRRINRYIETKLYPERTRLQQALFDFLHQTITPSDLSGHWQSLTGLLRERMNVQEVSLAKFGRGHDELDLGSALAEHLAFTKRALPIDEALLLDLLAGDAEYLGTLKRNGIGLLFPLVIRERLTAVINIGTRIDGEDYDSEELQILNNYSPQLAIASENLRLLEENFDKKRMEQELASARDTQKGLLPQEIPECPGLALAAVCHFCLEVAGDYYDVVPLADGKTCLAIGDVSGKGASASLLMASLQSSLNTAIPFGIPLSEIVGRINAVVYRNTSSDQFITFFIGIFDPKTKTLIYVNAGHDVPFVLRTDGSMEFLEKGGVILGCVPEWAYEEGAVQLSEGDTVLLYTDGVREAWNANEEEFGVERIQEILLATVTRTPSEQVARIEEEVVKFHGGSRFDDDFTLLVARVS